VLGVHELTAAGPRFRRVAPPTSAELEALLGQIVTRIARHLERRGLLMRDAEGSYLSAGPGEEDGLAAVGGHSITYRIAVGPNEGRKAFTLQTVAPALEALAGDERLAKHSGFSLHAAVPLHRAARGGHRAALAHRPGAGALHLEDAVPRIDIEQCERCGGKARIIASIEDPQVIGRILSHLQERERRPPVFSSTWH